MMAHPSVRVITIDNMPPAPDTSKFCAGQADKRLKDITPLEYVVENLLVKGYLYTLTAKNNHGKTTLAMLLAAAVTKGHKFSDMRTEPGRVLFLAGENAYDTDLKLKALGQHIDLTMIDVIPFSFDMRSHWQDIIKENGHWIYSLVIVDSVQAYFVDGDMNSNAEAKEHAIALRQLTKLPGNPAVVALAHPIKSADMTNLVPYGGGSLLNEIDGNLTMILADNMATLHHTKLRQPSFMEKRFQLKVTEFSDMLTNFGGMVTSTIFEAIDYIQAERMEVAVQDAKEAIVKSLYRSPGTSKSFLASSALGSESSANLSRMNRLIKTLREEGLVYPNGKYALTPNGEKLAKRL